MYYIMTLLISSVNFKRPQDLINYTDVRITRNGIRGMLTFKPTCYSTHLYIFQLLEYAKTSPSPSSPSPSPPSRSGDPPSISVTESGIIDPLVSKQPEKNF